MSDTQKMRHHMVDSQIRTADVTDERLVSVLRRIPRERFVPRAQIARAYSDRPVPLTPIVGTQDENPTTRWMLSPRDFAKLVHAAQITSDEAVLDIGCGRGYSSAVIAGLCDTVVGIELSESDVDRASETLTDIGIDNAAILQGALTVGAPDHGPYDCIIGEGAVREVPQSWVDQLVDGGRIAVIIQDGPIGRACVFVKSGDSVGRTVVFDASAPLLPGFEAAPEFVF